VDFPDVGSYAEGDHATFWSTGMQYAGFGFRTADHQTCSSNSDPTPDRTEIQCWGPRPDKGPDMWKASADQSGTATVKPLPSPGGQSTDDRDTLPVLPPNHVLKYDKANLVCAVDGNGSLACLVGEHGFILGADKTKLF